MPEVSISRFPPIFVFKSPEEKTLGETFFQKFFVLICCSVKGQYGHQRESFGLHVFNVCFKRFLCMFNTLPLNITIRSVPVY